MPRKHGEKGEFVETVTLEGVLSVFDTVDGPVVLSADVSDQLGCTKETARRKLEQLHTRGDLERRKVSRRVIYWRPHDGRPAERSEGNSGGSLERARDVLEEIDVVGRGAETQEVRREAILHAWRELRDEGEATTQELANSAFDEYEDEQKFGYSESNNHYRGYTFWDSCARDVLKQLPGVDAPEQRGNTWYFSEQ